MKPETIKKMLHVSSSKFQKKGFTPLEAGRPKAAVAVPSAGRPLTGFTLIELLVVVAIIGLLSSIIAFSVTRARMKSRDARRISDMKQIKSGTDLYFSTDSGYPDTAVWIPGNTLTCNTVSIMRIPDDPSAPVYNYNYTGSGASASGCGGTVRRGYSIQFYIENKAASYTMDEDGIVRNSGGTPVSFDSLL